MKYTKGLVSVIVPTYKRSEKLDRAIDSVLNQTYKDIELIVVNDNTPKDKYSNMMYEVIGRFNDRRLILVEQENHINGAAARNVGIRRATGEYIAFLDDDDYWDKDKIEKQIKFFMQQDSNCGAVSTLLKFYDNDHLVRISTPYKEGKIYREILRRQTDVTTCSVMLRHSALDETGYFDESLLRHQEIQLLSFFTYKYELKLLKEYLTCIDVSGGENNPNLQKMYLVKRLFFKSVEPIMSTLKYSERKRIYALHFLEIALLEYREHHLLKAFICGIKIFRGPITFYIATKRVINRFREQRMAKKFNTKRIM